MKTIIILVLLLCPAIYVMASPSSPGSNRDAGVPIDGGVSLLIVAGVGYGVKKARAARKKIQEDNRSEKGIAHF